MAARRGVFVAQLIVLSGWAPLQAGCAHAAGRALEQPEKKGETAALDFDGMALVAVAPRVWADPATTPQERARIAAAPPEAREGVAQTFGEVLSPTPLVIFCKTVPCELHFAGTSRRSVSLYRKGIRMPGARFESTEPTAIVLRVDDGARAFLQHELAHLELHVRLRGKHVPPWFDEGVATFASGTPDCTNARVRGVDDLRRLDHPSAWSTYTNFRTSRHPSYCQARAEVTAWVDRHGHAALSAVIDTIAGGTPFAKAYGPPLTAAGATVPPAPVLSLSTTIGDATMPFSICLWMKPRHASGVLAHLSETPIGTGWSSPLLGFNAEGHLVAQVLASGGPELSNFTVATAPQPAVEGEWSHVAMTRAPKGALRLYVNGGLAREVPAGTYYANGAGTLMYVTWGSYSLSGPDQAWSGAIGRGSFDGDLSRMQLFDRELSAEEVAAAAASAPVRSAAGGAR